MRTPTVVIITGFAISLATASSALAQEAMPSTPPAATTITIGSGVRAPSSTPAPTFSKRDLIARFKALQAKQLAEIQTLDFAIRKQLQFTQEMSLSVQALPDAGTKTADIAKQIDSLAKKKNEANARREILDRVIFTIDSKWTNQPLQQFLEQQFLEMASSELGDGRDGKLWKALTYLSICVREIPEPREDIVNVIDSYMNFTDILDPKTPAEFMASRDYTNGSESASANPVSKDKAGDGLEDVKDIETIKPEAQPLAPEVLPPKLSRR